MEKLGRIDVRITGFKGLIYKPATKFLPPAPDYKEDDVILSDDTVFNSGDDIKKEAEEK